MLPVGFLSKGASSKVTEFILITTTTATEQEANALARHLVDQRLAACVQVSSPIRSFYRWQGESCETVEFRCTIKSISSLGERIAQAIIDLHSYDTPQIVVMPIMTCSPEYAQWLRAQLE